MDSARGTNVHNADTIDIKGVPRKATLRCLLLWGDYPLIWLVAKERKRIS